VSSADEDTHLVSLGAAGTSVSGNPKIGRSLRKRLLSACGKRPYCLFASHSVKVHQKGLGRCADGDRSLPVRSALLRSKSLLCRRSLAQVCHSSGLVVETSEGLAGVLFKVGQLAVDLASKVVFLGLEPGHVGLAFTISSNDRRGAGVVSLEGDRGHG
jgi:hypothetical protein